MYVASRGDTSLLPGAVKRILNRPDVQKLVESVDDAWGGEGNYEAGMKDLIEGDPIDLDTHEQEALVDWLSIRDSISYFNLQIFNHEGLNRTAAESQRLIDQHAAKHGAIAWASIPTDYFFEVCEQTGNIEAMRLFRMVCAVRSIVGKKRFSGTVKDMIRARMIGGKSPSIAGTLAAESDGLAAELEALESRFRFDRILTEGTVRGFYGKLGAGRRVYLSTQTTDPKTMAAWIDKKPALHAAYRQREQSARTRSKLTSN